MNKKLLAGACAFALTALASACGDTANTNTANANNDNANLAAASPTPAAVTMPATMPAPDNSEVATMTDASGVETRTRTFNNPSSKVEKVVVTTRGGKRTARVYYRDKTVKELPESNVERALDATGDALVSAGGKTVDVTKDAAMVVGDKAEDVGGKAVDVGKDVGREVGDKAEDVGGATVKGAKKVGSEVADKTEDAAGKAASGAKKAGSATVKGAKKAGGAIKDAVTP